MTTHDERWFERIKRLNAKLPRQLIPRNYKAARSAFLNDGLETPPFQYDSLYNEVSEANARLLAELANDIREDSQTLPAVKTIYERKIAEKEGQLTLLRNIARAHREGEIKDAERDNQKLCEGVYGMPSLNIFNQLLLHIEGDLNKRRGDIEHREAYHRMSTLFKNGLSTDIEPLSPIRGTEADGNYITDAEYVKSRFEDALKDYGVSGWSVEISTEEVTSFKVRNGSRKIFIPRSSILRNRLSEQRLTETKLSGLIAHEIATHVVRKENGLRSALRLLSVGLDQYLPGEEGVATYRAQQVAGADDYAGGPLYLAVGIAYGLDRGGLRRSFRETFEILRDYHTLFAREEDRNVNSKAFLLCNQIYKGANEHYPGIILTRACAYREGNIRIHALLRENPEAARTFDVGKFDPANAVHVAELRELGVL